MNTRPVWIPVVVAQIALTACASGNAVTADQLDPPRMYFAADGTTRIWANAGAFKPVPLQLRARALEVCGEQGLRPAGFHPRALDENGKPFIDGGFYCVKD